MPFLFITHMDAFVDIKRQRVVNWDQAADNLARLQRLHRVAHLEAYGDQHTIPKDHFALHLPNQVRTDQALHDMFVVERLNIRFKHVADPNQMHNAV